MAGFAPSGSSVEPFHVISKKMINGNQWHELSGKSIWNGWNLSVIWTVGHRRIELIDTDISMSVYELGPNTVHSTLNEHMTFCRNFLAKLDIMRDFIQCLYLQECNYKCIVSVSSATYFLLLLNCSCYNYLCFSLRVGYYTQSWYAKPAYAK